MKLVLTFFKQPANAASADLVLTDVDHDHIQSFL